MLFKQKVKVLFIVTIILLIINYWFVGINLNFSKIVFPSYNSSLSQYAKTVKGDDGQVRRLVILAMTDQSFSDMAINLYESSFKNFNIHNYLFVGVGRLACEALLRRNIHCFPFSDVANSNTSSRYGTSEFINKVRLRSDFILGALAAGFSVLHMDLDIIFLANPMPDIEKNLPKYDMMTMWDNSEHNSGFLFINPTIYTQHVYTKMKNEIIPSKKLSDQRALNVVLNRNKTLKSKLVGRFSAQIYLCGKKYFETTDRNFPPSTKGLNNCEGCLVMHNNWIVSKEAKRYRFKEALMWWVDEDAYYSSQHTKYLSYANPFLSDPPQSLKLDRLEIDALKSAFAIAHMLGRILILPRFHCHGLKAHRECSLLNYLSIRDLDKHFWKDYRENSFFLHTLIPENLKVFEAFYRSQYSIESVVFPEIYTIKSNSSMQFMQLFDHKHSTLLDFSSENIVEEKSILEKLGNNENKVIHLSSLLGVEVSFSNNIFAGSFDRLLNLSFVRKKYIQF